MATVTAQILALADRQAAARLRISDVLSVLLLRLWKAFTGYYSPEDSARFAQQAAVAVAAAQRQTARMTAQYLLRVLDLQGAARAPTRVELPPSLRGVEPTEVYERPVAEYRYHRSQDANDAEAKERGQVRLLDLADMDVTTAMREASRQVLDGRRDVRGYRRVIHPELSAGGVCGLCIAASDRIYERGELLPLHELCKCGVMPIVGDSDPGRSLNRKDLEALYRAAGGTDRARLKRVRYQVNEHGELGPVLSEQGHRFRDAEDAARARRRRPAPPPVLTPATAEVTRRQLAVLEQNLPQLLARAEAGEQLDAPIAYHRRTIAMMQRRLSAAA